MTRSGVRSSLAPPLHRDEKAGLAPAFSWLISQVGGPDAVLLCFGAWPAAGSLLQEPALPATPSCRQGRRATDPHGPPPSAVAGKTGSYMWRPQAAAGDMSGSTPHAEAPQHCVRILAFPGDQTVFLT